MGICRNEEEARPILHDNAIELGNAKRTVIMNALPRKYNKNMYILMYILINKQIKRYFCSFIILLWIHICIFDIKL